MSVTAVAALQARPGRETDVRAQALSLIAPTLAEPGCLSYQPYAHPTEPGRWIVVETWESRTDFNVHLNSPHMMKAFAAGADLLTGPPELRVFAD